MLRGDRMIFTVVAERNRTKSMEQEMVGMASPSTLATTDACGCMPRSASTTSPQMAADQSPEQSALMDTTAAPESPRRSLKLVVTLTPTEGRQYRATLALGADNCDPILRSTTVTALSDALDQVPSLLQEAESHWQLHPRNPTAAQPPMRRPEADRRRPARSTPASDEPTRMPGSDVPADAVRPVPESTEAAVTPRPAGSGQLTLFG